MRLRFKIVLPSLIILSLIGFVGYSSISCPNVKYYKETEWLKTSYPTEKDSKCVYYSFYLNDATEPLKVKPWPINCILHFNQKVRVKLITQIKTYRKREPMVLMINKSYIPRKSIENHNFSC